jgi:hypothetical protein
MYVVVYNVRAVRPLDKGVLEAARGSTRHLVSRTARPGEKIFVHVLESSVIQAARRAKEVLLCGLYHSLDEVYPLNDPGEVSLPMEEGLLHGQRGGKKPEGVIHAPLDDLATPAKTDHQSERTPFDQLLEVTSNLIAELGAERQKSSHGKVAVTELCAIVLDHCRDSVLSGGGVSLSIVALTHAVKKVVREAL